MKTYNRTLDYMALAVEQYGLGRVKTAAKLLVKAASQPDVKAAIAIIEASNNSAYAAREAARVAASKKTTAKRTTVRAAEDTALRSLVGDIDELDDVAEDEEGDEEEVEAELEPEGEPEEVEDESLDENFAKVLSAMQRPKKVAAKKPLAKK